LWPRKLAICLGPVPGAPGFFCPMGLVLMDDVFFPNPAFGWVFLLALLSVLIAACYFDLRHLTIPNRLTIPALAAGFVINSIRLGMIGAQTDHTLSGVFYGLLFSLLGFSLGFGLFVLFWLSGLCGGGDVKLFAAVASWLGWRCSFWVWLLSFMILSVALLVRLLTQSPAGAPAPGVERRKGLLPYALPLTVAAAIVLLWFFRSELGLARAGAGQ
jgi:Flp pilus assembly protein protease CpaA